MERRRIPYDVEREEQRRSECPHRQPNSSCKLLNERLGWVHGMPLRYCDQCYESGPETGRGAASRAGYYQDLIIKISRNMIKISYPDIIVESMLSKHLLPEEAENYLLQIATSVGESTALRIAEAIDQRAGIKIEEEEQEFAI